VGKITNAFSRVADETPIDPSKLKKSAKWIKTRSQLNSAEAEGIAPVYTQYLMGKSRATSVAKFDLHWSCKLHEKMFRTIWTWAGKPRRIELEGSWSKFYDVEPHLYSLLEDLVEWNSSGMDMLEQASSLHHKATRIHPFENGNGRWARLMANIWLKKNRHKIVLWPDDHIVGCASSDRNKYIKAIKAADAGDIDNLLRMHKEYLEP
jgi:fido (protein-threonine AMPylation protein)